MPLIVIQYISGDIVKENEAFSFRSSLLNCLSNFIDRVATTLQSKTINQKQSHRLLTQSMSQNAITNARLLITFSVKTMMLRKYSNAKIIDYIQNLMDFFKTFCSSYRSQILSNGCKLSWPWPKLNADVFFLVNTVWVCFCRFVKD